MALLLSHATYSAVIIHCFISTYQTDAFPLSYTILFQVSPNLRTDKDVIMYRAYLAQKKYGVIMDDIQTSSPEELQAVKMFAEYMSSDSSQRYVL